MTTYDPSVKRRSVLGQKQTSATCSAHVCSSPLSRHRAAPIRCPLWAMCGRLRVGKSFLHVCSWSVQPCVRPLDAVHMTAGHNALRGSGPGHKRAFDNAVAQVGCPDRRIDRLCITRCSPSQPHITPKTGAISFTPQARRVPCSAGPWPSWPRPSGRACWRAQWPRPWWVAARART